MGDRIWEQKFDDVKAQAIGYIQKKSDLEPALKNLDTKTKTYDVLQGDLVKAKKDHDDATKKAQEAATKTLKEESQKLEEETKKLVEKTKAHDDLQKKLAEANKAREE